ncbi:hypothetical protein ATCC90586_009968 [Pythium insidiosum]|nr:hypothetical protein ATCC90586_009968 [Pythium insidiosum]
MQAPVAPPPALWTPYGYPTPAQLAIMCSNQQCLSLLAAVKATNPKDCVLVFGNTKINVKKIAETSCTA